MVDALRDSLGCKISLDEDFEGVSAIFLLSYLVDPILECLKGPKIIEDPLSDPIWSFGVNGGQAGSLSEGRSARRLTLYGQADGLGPQEECSAVCCIFGGEIFVPPLSGLT